MRTISEPVQGWVPSASDSLEVVAFVNHIRTLFDQTGTLTLRGEGGGVTDHAVNAGDAAFAFALPQPTVTHVPVVTTDHAVNADGDLPSFAFAVPQPTVTHTAAPTAALVLSDFDADGLETEVLALIEAAAGPDVFSRLSHARHEVTLPDGELDLSGDSDNQSPRFRFRLRKRPMIPAARGSR